MATAVNDSDARTAEGDNNTATAINDSCAEALGGDETFVAINDTDNC